MSIIGAITCLFNLLFVGGSSETIGDCMGEITGLFGGGEEEETLRRGLVRRSLLESSILPDENENLRGAVHQVQLE